MEQQLDIPGFSHGKLSARNANRWTSDGATWRAVGHTRRGWLLIAQLPSGRCDEVYPVNHRNAPIRFASLDTLAEWLVTHSGTDEFEVLL